MKDARHVSGALAVLGAIAALAAGASPALANYPYRTFHVVGEPVTLRLPWYWSAQTPPRPAVFLAYSPSNAAYVDLAVQKWGRASFRQFESGYVASSRQQDLTSDPKATFRWTTFALPGGRTVEIISVLHDVSASGKKELDASYAYGFFVGGVIYSFTYVCPAADAQRFLPVFRRSASSIRFH